MDLDFQFILNASASSSPSANALTGDVKPQTYNAKRRGHGRLGRVETGLLAHTLPIGTKGPNTHTGSATAVTPLLHSSAFTATPYMA